MRIGILLPTDSVIGNPANGVVAQARAQAAALGHRGHDVVYLNPWEPQLAEEMDVLHFFTGGFPFYGIENWRCLRSPGVLVMSPIIDSNRPNVFYRLAALAGNALPRLHSAPALLRNQARGSDVVVCRSEHELRRVERGLGVPRERIAVVLNGIDVPQSGTDEREQVRRRFDLPERFVLHVSAYTQSRKNVLRLVEATRALGVPLVVAGHETPGAIADSLRVSARRHAGLRLLGFVDRATRDALYALCHVFCLPSLHEGTGLAALEAGAAGAHVVITKQGGTRDYFRDLASYVSPTDDGALRSAIAHAWHAPRTDSLARHIRSCLSWDDSAAALEAAYERARSRNHERRRHTGL
jgi:glycosyltransferase involved in cell wall biosynthesis